MRGLAAAKRFHDENTGLPYIPFKIEENQKPPNDSKVVRVLALTEYDENRPEMPVIASLPMHQKFKVFPPVRCKAVDSLKPVPEECPLCRVKVPRTLRTFFPVRVRKTEDPAEVQVIEYGRNNVQEVQSLLDEIEGGDITSVDFKIKRIGKKKDTKYKWIIVPRSERPLSDEELALEVPDIEALLPVKEDEELETKAREWERSSGAKKVKNANDNEDDDEEVEDEDEDDEEIPF